MWLNSLCHSQKDSCTVMPYLRTWDMMMGISTSRPPEAGEILRTTGLSSSLSTDKFFGSNSSRKKSANISILWLQFLPPKKFPASYGLHMVNIWLIYG
jgi:hypothetical protein